MSDGNVNLEFLPGVGSAQDLGHRNPARSPPRPLGPNLHVVIVEIDPARMFLADFALANPISSTF